MQEIPESVQATVNSISRQLRKPRSTQNPRARTKKTPDIAVFEGRAAAARTSVRRGHSIVDTKLEKRPLQVIELLVDLIGIEPMTSSMP
jgi:hypothetical protein